MSITKTKVILIAALVAAAIAVPVWQQTRLPRVKSGNSQPPPLQTDTPLRPMEGDQAELERLRQWKAQTQPELLRLRGTAGVDRRASVEADELRAQLARQTNGAGPAQVSGPMADLMKQAMKQQAEGRLSRMTASLRLTPEQAQAARAILMRQAQVMSAGMQQALSGKYDKDELAGMAKDAGDPDEQIKALLTPDQLAAYPSCQQDEAAHNARLVANTELLQMDSTLGLTPEQEDAAFAALYDVNLKQLTAGATSAFAPASTNPADIMQAAFDQKDKALESVLTPEQLQNYRQQQALQLKAANDIWGKMGK